MPPINLANVNVTIQPFQEISSGKYNAGEVRLTSDHSLGKVNDHVHTRGKNVVPIPHAEVLAVKDAFVKALQQNGVAADEINRVRRELGLAPDGDKMNTYFGSVVVEEEVTVDLTAAVPTVTNVRVAQRFDDSDDLEDRYLLWKRTRFRPRRPSRRPPSPGRRASRTSPWYNPDCAA